MNVHRQNAGAWVRAPAKLNLFFEVLAKRSDGYHEIETLMVPIDLCDTLLATSDPSGNMSLDCRWAPGCDPQTLGTLPAPQENLALRAAALLRQRAGLDQGIHLSLLKRIPTAAGLGGGSSDAAAALLAANEVWNLAWSRQRLAGVAAELGSDVPFFLLQGAALCRGRGEQVEALRGTGRLHVVLVRPPEGLSTAQVYGRCQVPPRPLPVAPLVDALRHGDQRKLSQTMHNRLQPAAESLSPWIARLGRALAAEDCLAAQMSGSGSSYFGICRHARHAQRVARRLRARGWGLVYATSSGN